MKLIETITVGAGGAASIEFTSIPQTYTDLVLKISSATNRTSFDSLKIEFNSSTSSYSSKVLFGNGSSASSFSGGSTYLTQLVSNGSNTTNIFSSTDLYIPNYTGSTNKSVSIDSVGEQNATGTEMALSASLWSNTSAITTIAIKPNVGTLLLQYTSASLYGILKGSGGATAA